LANDIVLITTRGDVDLLGKRVTKDSITGTKYHSHLKDEFCFFLSRSDPVIQQIRKNHTFVVNFLPEFYKKELLMCLNASSNSIDLFKECSFSKKDSELIDCAIINEAKSYLECRYSDEKELENHVMIVGKIVGDKNE